MTNHVSVLSLDHFEIEKISLWNSFAEYKENIISKKLWAVTKFGNLPYNKANICSEDTLLFGSEINGLPSNILNTFDNDKKIFIPMNIESRSLNLSNAVAIVLYHAWSISNFS